MSLKVTKSVRIVSGQQTSNQVIIITNHSSIKTVPGNGTNQTDTVLKKINARDECKYNLNFHNIPESKATDIGTRGNEDRDTVLD